MQGRRLRQREGSNQGSETPTSVPFAAMGSMELPIKMLLKLLCTGKEGRKGEAGEHAHAILDRSRALRLRSEVAAS